MTTRVRVGTGVAIAIVGILVSLLAWQPTSDRATAVRRRDDASRTLRDAEILTAWPTVANSDRLDGVRFQFEDGAGQAVHPDARLIAVSGAETALRVTGDEQRPVRALQPGEYRLEATSRRSGWVLTRSLQIDRDELHKIRFEAPDRRMSVRVSDAHGTPWKGPLVYRVTQRPRFTPYSVRRRSVILDLSMGDDVMAPADAQGKWRPCSGPEFGISCERGATIRLEVLSEDGFAAYAWIDTPALAGGHVVHLRLVEESKARAEVRWGGEPVGEGFTVRAFMASTSHERWRVETDADGMASIPEFDGVLLPAFLLSAPGQNGHVPDSVLLLDDDTDAFLSGSLMSYPVGAPLEFPRYVAVRWLLDLPADLRGRVTRLDAWLCATDGERAIEFFRFIEMSIGSATTHVTLPSYVTTRKVVLRFVANDCDLVARADAKARAIRLVAPGVLEGVVVNAKGEPIPGVELAWTAKREGAFRSEYQAFTFRRATAVTDLRGRFRVLISPPEGGVLRTQAGAFQVGDWAFRKLPSHPVRLQLAEVAEARLAWNGPPPRGQWNVSVQFPRLGKMRIVGAEDGTVQVPLYEGPGIHQIEVSLLREGLVIRRAARLAPDDVVRLELPARPMAHQLEIRGATRFDPLMLRIVWRVGSARVEWRGRARTGANALSLPVVGPNAVMSLFLDSRFASRGSDRGQPLWEWRGPRSDLPQSIDLSTEREWSCSILGADRPVVAQLVDSRGRVQQFAVPAGPGTHSVKLRAATPPLYFGVVGGLPIRLATRPTAIDARALADGRPIRLAPELSGLVRNESWQLSLNAIGGWGTSVVSSEGDPELAAADGATGWGLLKTAGREGIPVRARVRDGIVHVELAGRLDD